MTLTKRINAKALFAVIALIGCSTIQAAPEPEPTPEPGSTIVYLVRHAEKDPSDPKAIDPSISYTGRTRANALVSRLDTAGVEVIVTSQFKRAMETAEPLAAKLGLTPEVVTAGTTTATDSAVAAVYRHPGKKVLIVGHSRSIPPIIEALGGPKLPNICETQYANLFIMYLPPSGKPKLVRQTYGKADPPREPGCESI